MEGDCFCLDETIKSSKVACPRCRVDVYHLSCIVPWLCARHICPACRGRWSPTPEQAAEWVLKHLAAYKPYQRESNGLPMDVINNEIEMQHEKTKIMNYLSQLLPSHRNPLYDEYNEWDRVRQERLERRRQQDERNRQLRRAELQVQLGPLIPALKECWRWFWKTFVAVFMISVIVFLFICYHIGLVYMDCWSGGLRKDELEVCVRSHFSPA